MKGREPLHSTESVHTSDEDRSNIANAVFAAKLPMALSSTGSELALSALPLYMYAVQWLSPGVSLGRRMKGYASREVEKGSNVIEPTERGATNLNVPHLISSYST